MKHRDVFLAPRLHLALLLSLLTLYACGGGSSDGRINLDITDSPTDDASSVVVEFTGVRAQPAGGGAVVGYDFPQPVQLDLAQLQGGVSASLIQDLTLPGGHYQWLELEVSATPGAHDSSLTLNNGGVHGLVLTAAGKAGLRTGSFDVQANAGTSFIIDFDARRSVLPPAGSSTDYRLQPALRMLDERAAGNIVGSAPGSLAAAAGCVPVVYVYAGVVNRPEDLDTADPASSQPVTEAPVQLETDFGAYRFTAAYLPAGTYTLAFTCDAGQDDPTKADHITFSSIGSVVSEAGATTLTALH